MSATYQGFDPLNESPSEKEGKYTEDEEAVVETDPSMKVPPKRKGNKLCHRVRVPVHAPSMKVPPKRKGNLHRARPDNSPKWWPSMKVPPKRKGNPGGGCAGPVHGDPPQ